MPSLAEFEANYWAPDREEVLAQMRAQQAPPSTYEAPYYWADSPNADISHVMEYTPQQQEYDKFAQNYWAPDRQQVLESMRGGRPGQGAANDWWSGPVGGGGFQGQRGGGGAFDENALMNAWLSSGGRTPQDLANFIAKNPQLAQGVQLVGSKKDKLQLPGGRVVDAVLASGEGGRGAQWLVEGPGGGGSGGSYGGAYGSSGFERTPNPTPFEYEQFQAPGAFEYQQWQAPTGLTEQNDPGFQARLAEGQKGLERSAAAKGTLLTGGTLKDINKYAQDYASNEFQNVYNRSLQDYVTGRGNAFENYQTNYQNALNAYQTNFETKFKPWEAGYNQAYQSWLGNFNAANQGFQNSLAKENQRFGQLYNTAALGLNATNQQAGYGQGSAANLGNIYTGYGNQAGELTTGKGNAGAAGQVGSANAWGNAFGNAANLGQMYSMYNLYNGGGNGTGAVPNYGAGNWFGNPAGPLAGGNQTGFTGWALPGNNGWFDPKVYKTQGGF